MLGNEGASSDKEFGMDTLHLQVLVKLMVVATLLKRGCSNSLHSNIPSLQVAWVFRVCQCSHRDDIAPTELVQCQETIPAQLGQRLSNSKTSNMSSVRKYSKCNYLRGHFPLLPLPSFARYALLAQLSLSTGLSTRLNGIQTASRHCHCRLAVCHRHQKQTNTCLNTIACQ